MHHFFLRTNDYIYPEKNLRAYPGVERGSREWEYTYKIRVNVEKSINHFKDSFCIANRKTQNEKTLDVYKRQFQMQVRYKILLHLPCLKYSS